MRTIQMQTLGEFYSNWDISVNAQNNNDVMVVVECNEVIKVLQDGVNIMSK